jgi:hypothetical protein
MRPPCLLLAWCALVANIGISAGSAEAKHHQMLASKSVSHRSRLVPARYFADPAQRRHSVAAVREVTEPQATIAGHYSLATVNCGTGCTVSWIVDRRTGAIIRVPLSSIAMAVVDVRGRRDSDRVDVIYGPTPSLGRAGPCRARGFRLHGSRFTPIGRYSPARCP